MSLTVFEGAPLPSNRFDRDVMAPLSSTSAAWGFLVKNDNTLFLVEDILYMLVVSTVMFGLLFARFI